jgi:4-amino-4-deoxy-L-arabinose transferase-like glycosyltransferase
MTTLALAALGRLYGAVQCETAQDSEPAGMRTRLVFWLALAGAVLDKGFVGPIIVGVTILALWAWDRRAPWLRGLGWIWGPLLIAAVILPWLAAVTVRTDGAAWSAGSSSGLVGIGPGGWAPPSLHLLALPVLLFPFAALAPAALIEAWKARAEPGVRFALCWLLPNWLLLEASPARLIHQALPLYGAVAWLAAFALTRPMGRVSRILGVALSLLAALAVTAGAIYLTRRFGGPDDAALTVLIGVLCLGASLAGALALTPRLRLPALAAAAGLGVAAHAAIAAGLAPRLSPLWVSERARAVMDRTGIDPRLGLAPGPVTVVGYDEPSLVFLLGTETELGDANDAAQAISEGRPVVIDQTSEPDFTRAMAARSLKATRVGQVAGLDYVDGEAGVLDVYRSDSAPPEPPVRDIPASEDDQAPDAAAPSSGARPTADHSSAAPRPRGKKAHAKHK